MPKILKKPPVRVAIHQPNLMPRLKVLQKLASADVWCVLDSVQYNKREWQNRTRIVAVHGSNQCFWLSIPVCRQHGHHTHISEITISNPSLTERLVEQTLLHAFRCAPYWDAIDDLIFNIKPNLAADNLVKLCVDITSSLLRIAEQKPTVLLASSLPLTGKGSALIAAICRYLDATIYLADSGARNYLQPAHFKGIKVVWQEWCEPSEKYAGIESWRDMSSINYLARLGPDRFAHHLLNGQFIVDPKFDFPKSNRELDMS